MSLLNADALAKLKQLEALESHDCYSMNAARVGLEKLPKSASKSKSKAVLKAFVEVFNKLDEQTGLETDQREQIYDEFTALAARLPDKTVTDDDYYKWAEIQRKLAGRSLLPTRQAGWGAARAIAASKGWWHGGWNIHFDSETIDYRVYQALLTPNGSLSDVPNPEFKISYDLLGLP